MNRTGNSSLLQCSCCPGNMLISRTITYQHLLYSSSLCDHCLAAFPHGTVLLLLSLSSFLWFQTLYPIQNNFSFFFHTCLKLSEIVTCYGLDVWEAGSPQGERFLCLHVVKTGSGAHLAKYSINAVLLFPWSQISQGMKLATSDKFKKA